jgi:hypothetical protein
MWQYNFTVLGKPMANPDGVRAEQPTPESGKKYSLI